jgi:branched-chain amino acid transport system substrate-binding protein
MNRRKKKASSVDGGARFARPTLRVYLLFCFLCFSLLSFAQEPYRRMLDTPKSFSGPEGQQADAGQVEAVRIGLFAPGEDSHPAARALIQGVSLALETANAEGGYQGVPFAVVRRWADNPWGAGSKEALALVYDDRVWAIIGSIASDSTHIVEQIATKIWLPLISPIVSDPSLTHINLPWIFRLPPDDRAQAEILIGEGTIGLGVRKIGLLTSTDHDGRYAAEELKKVMMARGLAPAFHWQIAPDEEPLEPIAQRIAESRLEGLVLRLPENRVPQFLSFLDKSGVKIPLFVPWIPGLNAEYLPSHYAGTMVLVQPFAVPKHCGAYLKFVRGYLQNYGEEPDACAVFGYDAACLIVKAIQNAGLSRTRLADALKELSGFPGASGAIQWDNGGGNRTKPAIEILNQP